MATPAGTILRVLKKVERRQVLIASRLVRIEEIGIRPPPQPLASVKRAPTSLEEIENWLATLLPDKLSPTEIKVCARRAWGFSDSEIAADLAVEATTVRSHQQSILAKLELKTVREIPRYVFQLLLSRRLEAVNEKAIQHSPL